MNHVQQELYLQRHLYRHQTTSHTYIQFTLDILHKLRITHLYESCAVQYEQEQAKGAWMS